LQGCAEFTGGEVKPIIEQNCEEMNVENMTDYTEQEIKLAQRIYDATMLEAGGLTTRKAKNFYGKLGLPVPKSELPDDFFLKTARALLSHVEDKREKELQTTLDKVYKDFHK
jgi:hypothetical protein